MTKPAQRFIARLNIQCRAGYRTPTLDLDLRGEKLRLRSDEEL